MKPVKVLFSPPEITVGQFKTWMKSHGLTHPDVARAIGMSSQGLVKLLYEGDNPDVQIVPVKQRSMLAVLVLFSGLPGLFDIQLIDRQVAVRMAEGFKALSMQKSKRTMLEINQIGYVTRMADSLLNSLVLQEVPRSNSSANGQGGPNELPPCRETKEDSSRLQG